jgi:protein required for attachment to host cells
MVLFAALNQSSELAFQEMMKCNMEAEKEKAAIEKHRFLMFLLEKKATDVVKQQFAILWLIKLAPNRLCKIGKQMHPMLKTIAM